MLNNNIMNLSRKRTSKTVQQSNWFKMNEHLEFRCVDNRKISRMNFRDEIRRNLIHYNQN